MGFKDVIKNMFTKKEPEIYTPQREHIDRRHDALQRHLSYYQKKREIPMMEARIKQMEKEQYGNGFRTPDDQNILKARNCFKEKNNFKWKRRGML